jgi:glycosyltransferase involved in cell wall biosynthesis
VSNLPANKLFINDGVNGNLVDVDNYKNLSQKIENVINNELFFKKVIQSNFEYVNKIANLKNNMERFIAQYEKLIKIYQ